MSLAEFGVNRLALGTVQFGMLYGIANQGGMPVEEHVIEIIGRALEAGILAFDTAQAYGESESRLGKAFRQYKKSYVIKCTSKLAPIAEASGAQVWLDSIQSSLERLELDSLECLLLHDPSLMENWERGLGEAIQSALAKGWIKNFGLSVYNPGDVEHWKLVPEISAYQVPVNVLDRRFITGGYFKKEGENAFFIRSVFLQGLLLLGENEITKKLPAALPLLEKLNRFCTENSLDKKEFLTAYVFSRTGDGVIVIGLDNIDQLNENLRLYRKPDEKMLRGLDEWDRIAPEAPISILNPSLWKTIQV